MVGQRAGSGPLQKYFQEAGVKINSATTAWCAGFINASLAHAGIPGTGSLAAGSFANWGQNAEAEGYAAGDIIGHAKGFHGHHWGHVMMATGRAMDGKIEVIEGNTGHRVKRAWINPYSEQFHRRAPVTHIHQHYLDGQQIASNTVTHVLKGSEHSRTAAYFDGYGTFAGADRQTATA
jgi:surface antigen